MSDFTGGLDLQSRVRHLDNARYHGGARPLSAVDIIGWHSTRGHDFVEAMGWDNRPDSDNPASYTFGVDNDEAGTIYRVNPVDIIPYSNGDANWPRPRPYPPGNGTSINRRIVAVALAGDLDTASGVYRHLTPAQLESAWWLGRVLTQQFPGAQHVSHRETSPGRKDDPRPQFLDMRWWRGMLGGTRPPSYDEYLQVHPLPREA